MTDESDAPLPKQQMQDHGAALPHLPLLSIDAGLTTLGKTNRLYECQCGERIWDD